MDIITLLVNLHMDLIARDIFSYLDETSLRNCESVSKSWYFVIREGKLWKQLFHQVAKSQPDLEALHQYKKSEAKNQLENENVQFKRLFNGPHHVNKNWSCGKFETRRIELDDVKVSHLIEMDDKRIIFGLESDSGPSKIMVWNRWKLESECLLVTPAKAKMTDIKLYGELIFTSHADKSILVWDLKTREITVQFLGKEVPDGMIYPSLHVDHNLLIGLFTSISYDDEQLDRESHEYCSCATIRRMSSSPVHMVFEKIELIPYASAYKCDSNNNYFALFLDCPEEKIKIELRSIDSFQVIRQLNVSMGDFVTCSNGMLATVPALVAGEQSEKIKFWDPNTLSCKQTWITQGLVNEVIFSSRHILFLDSNFKMTACNLPTFSDDDLETERMVNGIFEFELDYEEENYADLIEHIPFMLCDGLQFITVSTQISEGTSKSFLTIRDFIKPGI